MTKMNEGRLLRIFLGESDRHEGVPLFEWIVREARRKGLAGATVLRGLMGYGAHSELHTAKILSLSSDLPVVVEIVDGADAIESFLAALDGVVDGGLATVEKVRLLPLRGAGTERDSRR